MSYAARPIIDQAYDTQQPTFIPLAARTGVKLTPRVHPEKIHRHHISRPVLRSSHFFIFIRIVFWKKKKIQEKEMRNTPL
jgi:hypothetical protein